LAIAIASLAAIGFATLLPQPGIAVGSHLCLVCGSLGGVSAILNILLFVPLGIGLAISKFSGKRAVTLMFALSALIETAQLLLIPGRNATIGDVLTNSLGGALGFAVARYVCILLRPSPRMAVVLSVGWAAAWLAIQTAFSFGFAPALPRSQYYGEITRGLGDAEPFSGRVLSARIADIVVPDMRFSNSSRVRELLKAGATLTTTLSPPRSADAMTPIVRIADGSEREILVLAQNFTDMIFGVRTGAAALRVRPPKFAFADVFAIVPPDNKGLSTNALTVSAGYSAREAWMNANSGSSHARRIPVSTALGWTMLLPFEWFIEGTNIEIAISAIWTAFLLLPLGYWAFWVVQFRRRRAAMKIRVTAVPIGFLLLFLGLVVAPREFGLSAAPLPDLLAALAGILAGAALAARVYEPDRLLGLN
jgi:hypothetical protein